MFPHEAGPASGPYLHAWPATTGVRGEGFAPLSSPTHHLITRAALRSLPRVRAWLGPEAELLTWCYCGLQDMNWPTYSRFNPGEKPFAHVRFPDSRREWEISRYCEYNPITKEGRYAHQEPLLHYHRAVAAAEAGRARDAVRLLGIALHSFQDTGSPTHAAGESGALHGPGERPRDHTELDELVLHLREGFSAEAVVEELHAACAARGREVVARLSRDIDADVLDLQMACARDCVQATVDVLADFHRRFHGRLSFSNPPPPPPPGRNLLENADFARPDDEPFCPAGWVMKWWDRSERAVEIGREQVDGVWTVTVRRAAARVACLPTWPRAVRVRPREVYEISGRFLTREDAAGGLYAAFYDETTVKVTEHALFTPGGAGWQESVLRLETPGGAGILRAGAFGEFTEGPVRFTDLKLVRTR
ncbi:MAG: hypothetical protein GXP31_10925 [Kiritimatiellaeota bacterium]|nr:hypothetical protein [Kiritimatiellota bacterium]